MPIPADGNAAAPDTSIQALIETLISFLKAGENIYIHCSDGNGRTGYVASILLALLYNLSSAQAIDYVQSFHDKRKGPGGCKVTETHEQKLAVHRILRDEVWRLGAIQVPAQRSSDPALKASRELDNAQSSIRLQLERNKGSK